MQPTSTSPTNISKAPSNSLDAITRHADQVNARLNTVGEQLREMVDRLAGPVPQAVDASRDQAGEGGSLGIISAQLRGADVNIDDIDQSIQRLREHLL